MGEYIVTCACCTHYVNKGDVHDQICFPLTTGVIYRHEVLVCSLFCCVDTWVCAGCVSQGGIKYRVPVKAKNPVGSC